MYALQHEYLFSFRELYSVSLSSLVLSMLSKDRKVAGELRRIVGNGKGFCRQGSSTKELNELKDFSFNAGISDERSPRQQRIILRRNCDFLVYKNPRRSCFTLDTRSCPRHRLYQQPESEQYRCNCSLQNLLRTVLAYLIAADVQRYNLCISAGYRPRHASGLVLTLHRRLCLYIALVPACFSENIDGQ